MTDILAPTTNPCGSCPYRKDVPSGVWDVEEYAKLPGYDQDTQEQPPHVFMCHQQNGHLCAGWVAVHDMDNSLGLRLAQSFGMIDPEEATKVLTYTTQVHLFSSGEEAAAHGLHDRQPGAKAQATITKIKRRRPR